MPAKKSKKTNEEIFLHYATTDEAFRNALKNGNADVLSSEFDRIGIKFAAAKKTEIIETIKKIDWSDLKRLEGILLGQVNPMN
jgi:hypothetical protein